MKETAAAKFERQHMDSPDLGTDDDDKMSPATSPFLATPRTAGIVGCPFSGGQPKAGVHSGPLQLIESGLLNDIENLGWTVDFAGADALAVSIVSDTPDPDIGRLKQPRLVSRVTKDVADRVYAHASKGQLTVTLGGDHSLAMGTVSGTFKAYPEACLIWVDAHADINTPHTTESGRLHGCPVSFLLGLDGTSSEEIPEFSWIKPCLKPERIVYIGLRDIDAGERKILKDNNIKCFSMFHVDKYGIGKVVEMALDHVNPDRTRPIHLSFDVDALDPSVAPSTGTAVRGGLTFREGHYICEAIAETNLLVSLDIMEINPSLGALASVAQTVDVGRSLVRCALGETLL
uniref:Arginase n=2 Tax=Glaciozyma antarctica TaxID=105987 RepID=ARGI_GLAA1